MTYPPGGTEGWEDLEVITVEPPEVLALPIPIVAYWYDPAPLGGAGTFRPAVVRTAGASTVVVRGSVEATFTQPEVWGVGLLDSIEVFLSPCSLLLTVYDDDRTSKLWEVSTDPLHPRPYLVDAELYAEQELDVAAGKATLGTVTVTVIDPPQIAGDQDSGWLTERLATFGVAALAGRRCRLVRFINLVEGIQVIADGPAGTPSMDASYAGYTWAIRDTRETERKVRIFETIVQSLIPDEVSNGFGVTEIGAGAPILAARPIRGKFTASLSLPTSAGSIAVGLTGFPANGRRIILTRAAYEAVLANSPRSLGVPGFGGPNGDQPITNATLSQVLFRWRDIGGGPWTDIPGTTFHVTPSVAASSTVKEGYVVGQVVIYDRRLNPLEADYDPLAPALPADGQEIEFFLYGPIRPDERHFAIVEGITAGQFAKNVYDGAYSPLDPNTGAVVPTGILYDAAAVLAMTDQVKIRESAVIADARQWLEDYIYAPTGWIPALDKLGVLSPLSQAVPADTSSLLQITNDIAEPSPDWDAGERIINVIRFTYPRDFEAGPPDPPLGFPYEDRQNDVHTREILLEFRDPVSIDRHGEQVLELDGRAFRALGFGAWNLEAVGTQMNKWDIAGAGDPPPLTGEAGETAYQLAFLREFHLMNRYSLGAPTIQINARRALTGSLRAGSWVILALSWLPDYVTQRRDLLAVGQIVALGDLDCAWRRLQIEMVVPIPES